ncbi:ROK family protein [Cohnella nanjingensis]|uniref:ROK family protein n=1 Tax=Cohnella nanjingensis TaxID=1387779 RepID=A0A7X0VJP8_9BACL|nr:ROK family protein [Cohnella nanjingensis]MBB6674949.1 ROK family protein [Cohnella nanjingensis]
MSVWMGVDVGGTNIVCGAVNEDGVVLHALKRPTGAREGSAAVLDRIADMVREVAGRLGGDSVPAGVGVGIPGLVDPDAGISRNSTNLEWRDVPVARELERRLGVPVHIDNDVRMYIYGEAAFGAGRGSANVLGLTIGTGIAAAIVQDGRLLYGFKSMAGELGHGPVAGIDVPCGCGLTGCLETVASASGMVREAKRAIAAGRETVLKEWFPGDQLANLAAADLSRAMDAGDALATEILRRAGTLTGRELIPAVHLTSPEVVIIGGGGALAGERLLGPLREALMDGLLPDFRPDLRIKVAERGDDAGVVGSAMQARAKQLQK